MLLFTAEAILDLDITRFQLILASIIALVAIFFTILKVMSAEKEEATQKRILEEMRTHRQKAREEEDKKHREDLKKWEEGEEWPLHDKKGSGKDWKGPEEEETDG